MEKNRVFFQKPNPELFDAMGLKSVDMHFHTRFSDSYTRIQTIVRKAKKRHLGIAITDHNAIEGSIKAFNNAQDVLVVPGIEVSCMEGPHLLFYFYSPSELREFYEKVIKPRKQKNPYMAIDMKVWDVIEASKQYNCVRGAPHPYGYAIANSGLGKCVSKNYVDESVLDSIDAIEVINGSMGRRLNRKAHNKCMELGKSFTGGTDGHTIFEMGKVVTAAYADDLDSFLGSIIKKKNYVIGREIKLLPKLHHGTNVMTKHMHYAGPSIRVQYQINKTRVKSLPVRIANGIRRLANGKQ
jgi:predicted metal-dependent phosphoesterase TrpH